MQNSSQKEVACFVVQSKVIVLKSSGKGRNGMFVRVHYLIHVNVWTPQNLTSEEKTMLEKLNDSPNCKPEPGKSEKSFFDKLKEAFS